MDMHFEGIIFHTHADELARRLERPHPPFAILDVRSNREHDARRIPGSVRIDATGLKALPSESSEDTEFFVVGSGPADEKVRQAALALKALGGRRVVELTGGLWEWERRGLPLEGSKSAA